MTVQCRLDLFFFSCWTCLGFPPCWPSFRVVCTLLTLWLETKTCKVESLNVRMSGKQQVKRENNQKEICRNQKQLAATIYHHQSTWTGSVRFGFLPFKKNYFNFFFFLLFHFSFGSFGLVDRFLKKFRSNLIHNNRQKHERNVSMESLLR